MSKILLLITAALLITSCNQKNKRQITSYDYDSDSIMQIEKRNQEIQDSLNRAKLDSLSLIAWGDAKFGMSMKQALATEVFKNGWKYSDDTHKTLSVDSDYKTILKKTFNLNQSIYELEAYLLEDELTEITIKSYNVTANKIKYLVADCNIFIRNFSKKYGSPSFQSSSINISKFESGTEFTYARFKIRSKSITIKLGESYSGYKYYYIIYIKNNKFPIKKHVKTEKEIKEEQKRIEETKRIEENSF